MMDAQRIKPLTPVPPVPVPAPVKRDDDAQQARKRAPAPKRRDSEEGGQEPRIDEYV